MENASATESLPQTRPRRQLNHLATSAIDELDRKSDGAFSASPYFLQYVLELDSLGSAACLVPDEQSIAEAFDAPTMLGEIPLFPLSVGARFWLLEMAIPVLARDAELQEVAVAYAMNRKGARLCHELTGPRDIRRAVVSFARSLTVSPAALTHTVQRMLHEDLTGSVSFDDDGNPIAAQPGGTMGPTLALLVREYGESKEYWLYEASEAFLGDVLTDYKNRVAQAWASSGGEPTALDPSWAAFEAFRKRVEGILGEIANA